METQLLKPVAAHQKWAGSQVMAERQTSRRQLTNVIPCGANVVFQSGSPVIPRIIKTSRKKNLFFLFPNQFSIMLYLSVHKLTCKHQLVTLRRLFFWRMELHSKVSPERWCVTYKAWRNNSLGLKVTSKLVHFWSKILVNQKKWVEGDIRNGFTTIFIFYPIWNWHPLDATRTSTSLCTRSADCGPIGSSSMSMTKTHTTMIPTSGQISTRWMNNMWILAKIHQKTGKKQNQTTESKTIN